MDVIQMEGLKILEVRGSNTMLCFNVLSLLHITQHIKDLLSSAAANKMQIHLQAHELNTSQYGLFLGRCGSCN